MTTLFIETDNSQDIPVLKVNGRVDSETAPDLDNALVAVLNENKNKVVLDLQGVDYLSSAGLRTLVKALKDAQKSGGDLYLASVSEPVDVILRTVGMLQMFKMFPNSEAAVAGF
jgi:anti-sigma B factor antagonist